MGYTHRWFREKEIDSTAFDQIVSDFTLLMPKLNEIGIILSDPNGESDPVIHSDIISFNGMKHCGHQRVMPFANPWPSSRGGGIMASPLVNKQFSFAGTTLDHRCCNGDCSADSFEFPRILPCSSRNSFIYLNSYRQICETGFRPYDLAVTVFLVIAKHYLEERLLITSDGNDHQWFDGKLICELELGYGMTFQLDTALVP